MIRLRKRSTIALGLAAALAFVPASAFADTRDFPLVGFENSARNLGFGLSQAEVIADSEAAADAAAWDSGALNRLYGQLEQILAQKASDIKAQEETEKVDKVLSYDRALIEQIGTQESTGHTICCPSFSCAYADAVLDGTVHDHAYYTCSSCSWTDWGGGSSAHRSIGSDEQLLREAYDQISVGNPTVIHVAASYGEHWIALIGYESVIDSNHLTLSNFVALDPWDGAQVNAGSSFTLYGDGCEHISSRANA